MREFFFLFLCRTQMWPNTARSNLIRSDLLWPRVLTRWFQACFHPGLLHDSVIYKMHCVRKSNEIEDCRCIGKTSKCWWFEHNHLKSFPLSKEKKYFFREKSIENSHSQAQVTKYICDKRFNKYQETLS